MLKICFVLYLAAAYRVFGYRIESSVIGLGDYRITNGTDPAIINALQHPVLSNSLAFYGFDLNSSSSGSESTNITALDVEWKLQIILAAANVSGTGDSENTVEITSYALDFSDEHFPDNRYPLNSSAWTMCATLYTVIFTDKVEGSTGYASNASCVPHVGQACTEAWTNAFESAGTSNIGCKNVPAIYSIDECKNILQKNTDATAFTGAISNTTISNLVFYPSNGSYVDPQTGMVYEQATLPSLGLLSGQTFGYDQTVVKAADASLRDGANKLSLIALTIVPKPNSDNEISPGMSTARLLCGRASTWGTSSGSSASSTNAAWCVKSSSVRLSLLGAGLTILFLYMS